MLGEIISIIIEGATSWCDHSNAVSHLQLYFHVVLFVLYVVLSFESADKILWCNHLNATSYSLASTLTWYYLFCENCACDNPER